MGEERAPLVRAAQPWGDSLLAGLYDAFPFTADIPLHLNLAAQEGGRVLELGCGSGRLLLPLAEAGYDVTGLDASPPMLRLAAEKLERAGVRDRVRLVEGDLRAYELERPFALAIVPVKTFAYLTTAQEQLSALRCAAAHLRAGGLLVLDLLNPSPAWLAQPAGSVRQDLTHVGDDGVVVSRTETVVSTDLAAQVRLIRSAYDVVTADTVRKRFVEWPFRYTFRFEAEHLLARAGFTLEHVYGGYDHEPFVSESPVLLLLARLQS